MKSLWKHFLTIPHELRSNQPLAVGRALTKVFLVLVGILAVLPQCKEGSCSPRIWEFFFYSFNEIGDTLAGIAGVLAFLWIIITVWLQSIELQEQREVLREQRDEFAAMNNAMAAQKFESTFFELLSTFNSIVNAIDLHNTANNHTTRGRDCFKVFYTRLTRAYRAKIEKSHGKEVSLEMAYKAFWTENQLDLGHYFRFLFNFFRFVSESNHKKPYHGKLLRSQLSDQELLILFYNCLSEQGSNFRAFAQEFEIFDNLPTVRLLDPSHIDLMEKASFGNNPMLTRKDMRHSINQGKSDATQ